MTTGNNERFLRSWNEIEYSKIGFHMHNSEEALASKKKWFPYNKGGGFRKWYGLNEFVVLWENNGELIKKATDHGRKIASVRSERLYFKKSITWATLTTGIISCRYSEEGHLFDDKGSSAFLPEKYYYAVLGLINSSVGNYILHILNPTMSFQSGNIGAIPVVDNAVVSMEIKKKVINCINICKEDWDAYENSWDFIYHPLVNSRTEIDVFNSRNMLLSAIYQTWEQECESRFSQLKSNEEELNRIFIEIYGLQDELTPEVEDKDITVRKADLQRDIRSLISYAVGCMFGRYSLEIPGLVYAGGEWPPLDKAVEARKNHPEADPDVCSWTDAYGPFIPDLDNCIPILDSDYLPDDIVGRFIDFIQIVYGEEALEENLDFIAGALGGKGTTSREVIRNYFLKDFYKDHLKIYQKRPIYWLFDSGKQDGFKALIYMHRYNEDTIGRVRADYLHKVQERYENEVRAIDAMQEHILDPRQRAAGEKRKEKLFRQIKETKEYDERIGHLALERIAIDLDDGVKVNYGKVQTDRNGDTYQILAPIK